jgi:hypothetical protein
MDEEDSSCPLCMEDLDVTDRNFRPCPCGYHLMDDGRCKCTPQMVARYRSRISGPLLDRFDLRVRLRPVAPSWPLRLLVARQAFPSCRVSILMSTSMRCSSRRGSAGTPGGRAATAASTQTPGGRERTAAFQGGERFVEIAAVACGLPGEVGEDARIVSQLTEGQGIAECYRAVVGPFGGGFGEDRRGGGYVGMVEEAAFEDGDPVHTPGGGDHFIDQGDFDGPDGEELAMEPAAPAEKLGAVLTG